MQNFLSLWLNAGAQITHDGPVQRPRQNWLFGFSIGGPTDELHFFTKSNETGLGSTINSTALPRGIRQISICAYY